MQRMSRLAAAALMVAAVFIPASPPAGGESLPKKEDLRVDLTLAIARWHGLSRNQAILMLTIYDHELAPREQMKTCSYFGIRRSMRPELAYCETVEDEYETAARICAGTIKRYCPNVRSDTLRNFNHGFGKGRNHYPGYAEDPWWWIKVKRKMKRWQNITY